MTSAIGALIKSENMLGHLRKDIQKKLQVSKKAYELCAQGSLSHQLQSDFFPPQGLVELAVNEPEFAYLD